MGFFADVIGAAKSRAAGALVSAAFDKAETKIKQTGKSFEFCKALIGLPENEARDRAHRGGFKFRIKSRDSVVFDSSFDVRADRINADISGGKVVKAYIL